MFLDVKDVVLLLGLTVFGAVSGSAVCCLSVRLAHGESWLRGRSHCPRCRHDLKAKDLIPLVSYMTLKGKCRYCHEKIPIGEFIFEWMTILLLLLVYLFWGVTLDGLSMALMTLLFLAVSICDLESGIIPNGLIISGILIQVVSIWFRGAGFRALGKAFGRGLLIAAAVGLIVMMTDRVLRSRSMGGGDLKLIFMLGIMTTVLQSLMALWIACIIGMIVFLISGKTGRQTIPFGPPLCAGWLICCFLSQLPFFNGLSMI